MTQRGVGPPDTIEFGPQTGNERPRSRGLLAVALTLVLVATGGFAVGRRTGDPGVTPAAAPTALPTPQTRPPAWLNDGSDWWTKTAALGPGGDPLQLTVTPNGTVWVATAAALLRYDGDRWTPYPLPRGRNFGAGGTLIAGPDDTLWASTRSGVAHFTGTSWVSYDDVGSAVNGEWLGPGPPVTIGGDGSVWATSGTDPFTLVRFDGQRFRGAVRAPMQRRGAFAVTTDGTLWASRSNFFTSDDVDLAAGWLYRYDGSRWSEVASTDTGTVLGVQALQAGPRNSLWSVVWTSEANGRTLTRFDGRTWSAFVTGMGDLASIGDQAAILAPVTDKTVWVTQATWSKSVRTLCRVQQTGIESCLLVGDTPVFTISPDGELWTADATTLARYVANPLL